MNDNQQKFADMVQQNKSTIYTVCYMFSVSVSAMLVSMRQKKSLKFLFLSDIFLFPPIRQQVPILA